ncbi:ABC transporter ATP-binding protein/permease [Marinobacterium nitratireducens]|uniref:ABC transporter ATP-binding protein/permease n=1 Tax=Marinobacterium nitratireducens TaxID=518897 RepID=A0A918DNI5_9GAMM|nr:ABC transporter transmembrane domain-containing protein [Marinobacterium nitratireducens]GGO76965.1 ABC transporter ATP-binding protein/permease [Marinobacterium nitratireducens]
MSTDSEPPWQVARALLGFIRPYRRQVTYALLALMFTAAVTLSIGQGLRLIIDRGLVTGSAEGLAHHVLLFLLMVLLLATGTFARYYWVTWIGERVVADIRMRVFEHLISLHPGFFERNRSLEIQSRLTADTTLLQSVIGSSLSVALRNLLLLAGGIVWLFLTNARLSLLVLISVPLVVVPILYFGRRVRQLSRHSQDRVADVGAYVGEVLSQIKTVQAYNHQPIDRARFGDVVERAFAIAIRRTVQRGLLITAVILLVLGAVGLMIWVGGLDVVAGRISAGELAAFVFYSVIVGAAVGALSEVIGELQRAAGAAERLIELLAAHNEISAPSAHDRAALPARVLGAIALEEVRFSYPMRPELPAVDGLTLSVRPGETLALVGPSGAGKSTVFDLLLRFYDVNSGAIRLEGIDIRRLDPAQLRSCFALVSQHPVLFRGSIIDNLRYARPDANRDAVIAAARAAYAHDFIEALPAGYDTELGDTGSGLSGGQKQRLAIARALLADAPVLLLDEATSALDAQSERTVQQALDGLMRGRTTLVIAHRLATVQNADRIAVLDQGCLIAVGSHRELMISCPLYAKLARLQFETE